MLEANRHGRRSLSVGDVRAQMLHEELLRLPDLECTADIAAVPHLSRWPAPWLADALDRLVADGLVTEACDGRLVIHRRAPRA
ncbi:MAG TPA: hypothetical protein VGM33_12740 [Baekduia sp.]